MWRKHTSNQLGWTEGERFCFSSLRSLLWQSNAASQKVSGSRSPSRMASTMCASIGGSLKIGRVGFSLPLLVLGTCTGTCTVVALAVGAVEFPSPAVGGAGGYGWRKLRAATAVPVSVPVCPGVWAVVYE